jgi:hypothetical protein
MFNQKKFGLNNFNCFSEAGIRCFKLPEKELELFHFTPEEINVLFNLIARKWQ